MGSSERALEFAPPANAGARLRALVSAWAVPAIIALDVGALIWLAISLNIWVDEAYTLQTASHGVAYAIHQAIFWELQPPVYFVLIAVLHSLANSILVARLFSIACVAVGLWVAGAISVRLWPAQHPAWLVAVLAVNPFIVGIAVEIRVYAMVFLLSALLIYFFIAGFLGDESGTHAPARWARVAFVITAIVALYTQYYLGFLLPAFAVALLALGRGSMLRAYLGGMAVVALCAVPILFFLRFQLATNSVNYVSHHGPLSALLLESKILASVLVSADALPSALRWVLAFVCVAATLLMIATVGRRDRQSDSSAPGERGALGRDVGFALPFIIVAVGAAAFAIVVSTAAQPLTLRYSTGLFLPALLCVYAMLSVIPAHTRRYALATWTVIALTTTGISLSRYYENLANIGDWIRVASYIQIHESAGQPIVVFEPQAVLPLAHYYHGANQLVPMPRPIDLQRYDLRESALHDEGDVARTFVRAGGASGQVWLVTTSFCRRQPIDFHCELLDRYVMQHFAVLSDERFYWSRVRLLQRVH